MTLTKWVVSLLALLLLALVAMVVTAFGNVGTNASMLKDNVRALPAISNVATVQDSIEESEPDEERGRQSVQPVRGVPDSEVDWTEKPYPEDNVDRVFTGFGSYDNEAQAEVDQMFVEMLDEFAGRVQELDSQ